MYRYQVQVDDRPHTVMLTDTPLHVAHGDEGWAVEFWAEWNTDQHQPTRRVLQVFGTGHDLPADARWLGTTARSAAGLVWHLYELLGPEYGGADG